MSPNNEILLNSVLGPKLLNIPSDLCYFLNLDFLLLHQRILTIALLYFLTFFQSHS